MNGGVTPKSPDEEVTSRITEALAKAQLLTAESLDNLRVLLVEGKMTAEEWKFLLEPIEPKSENKRAIANLVHVQMQPHYWEEPAAGYEVKVTQGFVELKSSAYASFVDESVLDFRRSPTDKSNMSRYLFGMFQRCLYSVQKFQSDSERRFAVILDRETVRWFKPAKGVFRIHYRHGSDHPEYQPDFVAETDDEIVMLEVKMKSEMDSPEVLAKKQAAVTWCGYASDHAKTCGGKPWRYALIAHDVITENMSLASLVVLAKVKGQTGFAL